MVPLNFGLAFCHVMEMPGKLQLNGREWLVVQQNPYIAFGTPIGAFIEVASILTTWLLVFLVRDRLPTLYWTVAGRNQRERRFGAAVRRRRAGERHIQRLDAGAIPADWPRVRDRWEIGHAIHAALFGLRFSALAIVLLVETQNH